MTILVELRVQLVVRLTCYKGYVPSLRPPTGHQAEPQAANSQARPSCRYLTVPRFPCGSLVLMRFLFMSVSKDTYSGRRRSHLVVVHRLSLGLAKRLAEEDKDEGEGVVRTTQQSLSLHLSGQGDVPNHQWARWCEPVPPSWRSPRGARVAS